MTVLGRRRVEVDQPAADDHPHGPLRPPGDTSGLIGVFRRRYLLKLLVQKELRVRYQQSLLGIAWSYAKPLVRLFAYFVVIGVVLGRTRAVENFAIHIMAGFLVMNVFSETLNAGSASVLRNKSLVRKMNLPRETFPVASLLVTVYHMIPTIVIVAVAVGIMGWTWDPMAVASFALAVTMICTLSLAVALAGSALTVHYRDFKNLVETIGMLIFWSAPMIYDWKLIDGQFSGVWEQVYLCNPVAVAVMLSQEGFWVPTLSDPNDPTLMPDDLIERGLIMLAISVLLVYLAQRLFRRLEKRFVEQM